MTRRIELAPGDYTVRNITAGTTSTVTVPTLTVSIVQTAPTVGQTLTLSTNAAPGASYQWRRGGTPISGATSATYTTVSADAGQVLTCRVVSGVQDVTSAGVTVGAAAAFSAAFVPGSFLVDFSEFPTTRTFPGVAVGAADSNRRVYVPVFQRFGESDVIQMAVNGDTPTDPIASLRLGGPTRQVLLYERALPTGTTATFTFTKPGGNDFGATAMAVIRAVGAHTSAFNTADAAATTLPITLNTLAGDAVFVWSMTGASEGANYFTPPSGFTEHADQPLIPASPYGPLFLGSGVAAGGTPETFTLTKATDALSVGIALRLRAA
jgi:hypothetical protein